MSYGPRGRATRIAASACLAMAVLGRDVGAKEMAPYHVAVAVRWGEGAGSDAFRDDLARSLASTLATACFTTVSMAHADGATESADVAFDVLLTNAVDETRFDDSIAGALQPGEPTQELRRTTHFEVTVDAQLTARATGASIQTKHLVAHVSRRPVYVGEDPQAMARAEAIEDIVHDLSRALGCGKAKLTEKVRDALAGAGPVTPAPR